MSASRIFVSVLVASTLIACGDESSSDNGAGEAGTGGGTSSGGAPGTGGGEPGSGGEATGSGGAATGTGGAAPSTGGQSSNTGGAGDDGGNPGTGGAPPINLPPGSGWIELPDTAINSVCACNDGFPEVCANSGCSGIFAWSSGAFDTLRNRFLVFGGGHSDYFGNEIFAMPLTDPAMTRLTDPGLPPSTDCEPSIAGGTQPSSRHTYDSLLYLEHVDRLFFFGGSKSPCGYLSDDTWTYSFETSAWEWRDPTGPIPNAVPGIVADYDPMTDLVFLHDEASLYSYDVDADAFQFLVGDVGVDYHMSGSIDLAHRKLVLVGAGKVYVYDLDGDYSRVDLATTGADSIVESGYPGLAYNPDDGGRIFAWNGGDTVYALDLDTAEWTGYTSPNGPGAANETGTYKRFRYVGDGTFVLVNAHDQNAYLFRL